MDALFASGRVVDLVLALVAAEALLLIWLLAWLRRRGGAGPPLAPLLANLASGAALMLALRCALVGSGWPAVAGWMLAGLLAHLADLALRFAGAERGRIAARGQGQEQADKRPRSRAAIILE